MDNNGQANTGFDAKADAALVFETSDDVKVVSTFDEMNLKDDLLRGIYAYSMFLHIIPFSLFSSAHHCV